MPHTVGARFLRLLHKDTPAIPSPFILPCIPQSERSNYSTILAQIVTSNILDFPLVDVPDSYHLINLLLRKANAYAVVHLLPMPELSLTFSLY